MNNNCQLKIKQLELEIESNKVELSTQKELLITRLNSLKANFFLTEILVGGFTFGYLLAPSRLGSNKRRFAGAVVFLKITKWIKQLTPFLKKAGSESKL